MAVFSFFSTVSSLVSGASTDVARWSLPELCYVLTIRLCMAEQGENTECYGGRMNCLG